MIVTLFLLSAALFGCSKLNQENYNKIKVGMDYQEVISIIGNPDTCDAGMGMKKCVWGDESKNVTIQFVVEKVVFSSMKGL